MKKEILCFGAYPRTALNSIINRGRHRVFVPRIFLR
nr:MAG TPA: hypothetical protein [Caudoviricetes sp.]